MIPVQVLLASKAADPYRVLRASFVLVEAGRSVKLPALGNEQTYQLSRHGYGAPVCGMIFGGILGLPSLITTMNANDRLREDYARKHFQDAVLEPGREVAGVVFFDPASAGLTRQDTYKLVVDLENTVSRAKVSLEYPL